MCYYDTHLAVFMGRLDICVLSLFFYTETSSVGVASVNLEVGQNSYKHRKVDAVLGRDCLNT